MNKSEFLNELKTRLESAAISSAQEVVSFYDEAISDRIDAGMSEEEAVAQVGNIDEIIKDVKLDLPMATVVSSKIKESRQSAEKNGFGWLWIVLAIVGFPIWLPLLIVAVVVVCVIYIALWVVVFSLFVTLFALGFAAVCCLLGAGAALTGGAAIGMVGAACILAGLVIILWQPVLLAAKGLVKILAGFFTGIKKLFI